MEGANLRNEHFAGMNEFSRILQVEESTVGALSVGALVDFNLLDDSTIHCELEKGFPGVPEKLPSVIGCLSCKPESGGELHLIIDYIENTMTGTYFSNDGSSFYLELLLEDNTQFYILYESKKLLEYFEHPQHNFSLEGEELIPDEFEVSFARELTETSITDVYVYKIALLTTPEFARVHGNSVSRITSFILNVLSRVNGIYLRQVGVYFELVDNFELGFCLKNDPRPTCGNIFNGNIRLDETSPQLAELGIPVESYDIGQRLFSATAGGKARLKSFCSSQKAYGASPSISISVDASTFVVLFFAHELGHQLGAKHTYRDCTNNNRNNLFTDTAVEPGSGSTLMSFGGGICGGSTNIVKYRDPYFHSTTVRDLRANIIARHIGSLQCGRRITRQVNVSSVHVPESCRIPLGSSFSLLGFSDRQSGQKEHFAWDRSDAGAESYIDLAPGRFRSFQPVIERPERFLPNMYYWNFGLDTDFEALPTIERAMTFKFTSYANFALNDRINSLSTSLAGVFVQADTSLQFVNAGDPLKFKKLPNVPIPLNRGIIIRWELSPTVRSLVSDGKARIYFAQNTMTPLLPEDLISIDYASDVKDLQWNLLSEVNINQKFACILISDEMADFYGSTPVAGNIMIKANVDSDPTARVDSEYGCFSVDVLTDLTFDVSQDSNGYYPSYEYCDPTISRSPTMTSPTWSPATSPPTLAPSDSPTKTPTAVATLSPTRPRTDSPTQRPSVSPTKFPTKIPTKFPTNVPTKFPSNSPTNFPTLAPTIFQSMSPTNNPTVSPIQSPSTSPTLAPTEHPTLNPSRFPTQNPTIAPTVLPTQIPTGDPTVRPTMHPTNSPSSAPTSQPSKYPTALPTLNPTNLPTNLPTSEPSPSPSMNPTSSPSWSPTSLPSMSPTSQPTLFPSFSPSKKPSYSPSKYPTGNPTSFPSIAPTSLPTSSPTSSPSITPTYLPTSSPTSFPSITPTSLPTSSPTSSPSITPTSLPTSSPISSPSITPTYLPTSSPTFSPTITPKSTNPSGAPSLMLRSFPTLLPTASPTEGPSRIPSSSPSGFSTLLPTSTPSLNPIVTPTKLPSRFTVDIQTVVPTQHPTGVPVTEARASSSPISFPTLKPSPLPTKNPVNRNTQRPTTLLVVNPTSQPTFSPSFFPTSFPSARTYETITTAPTIQLDTRTEQPTINTDENNSDDKSSLSTEQPTSVSDADDSADELNITTVTPTSSPETLTMLPTFSPTFSPSRSPSSLPSTQQTYNPTNSPIKKASPNPSSSPSRLGTDLPTVNPTVLRIPTSNPSSSPSRLGTDVPTVNPTVIRIPTSNPSSSPSRLGTYFPTVNPTVAKTASSSPSMSNSDKTILPSTAPTQVTPRTTGSPSISMTEAPAIVSDLPFVIKEGMNFAAIGGIALIPLGIGAYAAYVFNKKSVRNARLSSAGSWLAVESQGSLTVSL